MTDSSALIRQISDLTVPPGTLALWALGQSGFVIKGGRTIAYIDPYLTDSIAELVGNSSDAGQRRFPSPLAPAAVNHADLVFCTHEHPDHTDAQTVGPIAAASREATFVGPASSQAIMREAGIADDRIIVPEAGRPYEVEELTFIAIPAAHYDLAYDPEQGYRYLGFVIQLNGVTLYHAGDTILYDGLVERVSAHGPIDIACLPLNGRDWWREQQGLIGNLLPREGVPLAQALGADVLVPIHNDLFANNRINPAILADYLDRHAPQQKCHYLQPGELYYYIRPAGR